MLKSPATYQEQIDKLKSHNCIITDEDFCAGVLMRVSYYRLSAYFLPFRMPDGKYRDETHFEAVYSLYEFDRKLRNILFPAIEETEVFLRNRFSYYHTHS